ncbi:hypothetical protein [Tautonia sociabilis]|uniref:Uncharacterized protein n=1 Tax=Tautonia sociabilis TaxID=2080755 RepID=A0A432MP30_9BACT|nr:hypothetical protein [Tautonia sociabilis]RUL89194.1 hypothetical protein TsocGM_03500 [Tautonia sociabilis]
MSPALMLVALLPPTAVDGPVVETVTLEGEVVLLAEALGPFGLPEQQGPIADQVVLKRAGGEIIPLLYNVGSRAFFEDGRLRNRPAELVARRLEGLPYLQVVSARVADESGALRIPEYYCDICTISVRYDQPCPCCQAPMELRFKPED